MVRLNRTTEYGLMALSYIRSKGAGELTSAREIADQLSLPFEILAKTLQRLKEQGIVASTYGTRGGYVLARDLSTLDLAAFLSMMEGPVALVECTHKSAQPHDCEYSARCSIQHMMSGLNGKIQGFLRKINLEELTAPGTARPVVPLQAGEEP